MEDKELKVVVAQVMDDYARGKFDEQLLEECYPEKLRVASWLVGQTMQLLQSRGLHTSPAFVRKCVVAYLIGREVHEDEILAFVLDELEYRIVDGLVRADLGLKLVLKFLFPERTIKSLVRNLLDHRTNPLLDSPHSTRASYLRNELRRIREDHHHLADLCLIIKKYSHDI